MPERFVRIRQRRALWIVLAAGFVVCALGITYWQSTRALAYEILGVRTKLGAPIVEVSFDSGWNGDGFNFSQYAVPEGAVDAFLKLAAQGSKFPLVPDYRREWRCIGWQPTPLRDEDESSARFALSGATTEMVESTLRKMRQPKNWYAQCVKRDDRKNISNSELFFFEPARAVLTTAIVNT
jgi:hypothetical protein